MLLYMSVYILSTRISSVENSVDELGQKADSYNAVLSGTTTINGPASLNGPVAFGSSIVGIDVSDVNNLQTALDAKASSSAWKTSIQCVRRLERSIVSSCRVVSPRRMKLGGESGRLSPGRPTAPMNRSKLKASFVSSSSSGRTIVVGLPKARLGSSREGARRGE